MTRRVGFTTFVAGGVAVVMALVLVLSPQASSQPDGLERVAADHGFADTAEPHALDDLATADAADDGGLVGPAVGVLGVGICFAVAAGLVALGRYRRMARGAEPTRT